LRRSFPVLAGSERVVAAGARAWAAAPALRAGCIDYTASYMEASSNIPPPLHALETEVMQEVWRRGLASVREVMEAMNRHADTPRAYTTYMTTMARLDGKGMLARTRGGKADVYRPVYTPDEYADLRAQAGVDSLVEQFGDLALGHFARQMAQLDPQRRRSLQRVALKK
jgi:predicted transcriptional regulator